MSGIPVLQAILPKGKVLQVPDKFSHEANIRSTTYNIFIAQKGG